MDEILYGMTSFEFLKFILGREGEVYKTKEIALKFRYREFYSVFLILISLGTKYEFW